MTVETIRCPACGDEQYEVTDRRNWLGATGIRTSDGTAWTRLELDDETIRRVGRGTHTLVAVPNRRVEFIKAVIATCGDEP